MEIEWDEAKRRSNLAKHSIDFADAAETLSTSRTLVRRSNVKTATNEDRYVAIGKIRERLVAIVFTRRGEQAEYRQRT
jgi:uncharacterized DUF497 family protein